MKTESKILLGLGAAVALLAIRKNASVSGIGAARKKKQSIWFDVERAQQAGIDLSDKDAWMKHESLLRKMASGKIREDGAKPMEQRYFNKLSRAYKSVAGLNIRPEEAVVRNEYGDTVLIYRDFHLDELPERAAQEMYDENESLWTGGADAAYRLTIAAIALGKVKFVWKSKKEHRGVEQLIFGASAPSERKQRISYLATPEKGGVYPEMWAHRIWERWGGSGDTQEITDGVLDAIRDCESVGWARKYCLDSFIEHHQVEEPALYEDMPF